MTEDFPAVERRGPGRSPYDPENNPRARASDDGWRYWLSWCYRHFVPAIAIGVAALSLWGWQHEAHRDTQRQIEGRRIAVDVLCGGLSGVEDAGKQALEGRLEGMGGQGIPAVAIRDYVGTISHGVIDQAGVDARKVLKPDGQIDCDRLRVAAKTQP